MRRIMGEHYGGNYAEHYGGALWGELCQIFWELSDLDTNAMQNCQKQRLLCHNAFLCVHFASICLDHLHSFLYILLGNIGPY